MEPFLQHRDYLHNVALNALRQAVPVDYSLVLEPHEALQDEIQTIRRRFAEDYHDVAETGPVYITIARFRQTKLMESRILPKVRHIAASLEPLKIELNGFGSLPSHTIFINITSKVEIFETVKAFRSVQRLMKFDEDNKPYFNTEPNVVVARKLDPFQYEKGWQEYSQQHFHGRFIADNALLLRRKTGEGREVIERLPFKGLKSLIVQKDLFAS